MRAYAPKYYKDFKCTAERCTHSCCIGWRISLDDTTRERYLCASGHYATALRSSISEDCDGFYIPTLENGRCPHLDDRGLCRVITEYGDEYLSEICREHPRYYNVIGERIEAGIGASCPEAARLILEGESSLKTTEIDLNGIEPETDNDDYYSALELREKLSMIIDECDNYADAENRILLELDLPQSVISGGFRREIYTELEYLYPENREVIFDSLARHENETPSWLIKVLEYLLYRHLPEAQNETEAIATVAFALISARTVGAISQITKSPAEALRLYSEEIEYSESNTESILFAIESELI